MKYQKKNKTLYFYFDGEFDHLHIAAIKDSVISYIDECQNENIDKVIFDFEEITFVDSTGIGFVLARYKQCNRMNKTLELANLSTQNRIIFEMSGVFQIIKLVNNEVKL